jgi:hypothetical protein
MDTVCKGHGEKTYIVLSLFVIELSANVNRRNNGGLRTGGT